MSQAGQADDGPVLVGCDIGTGAVKTIVTSCDGALLGRAATEHRMYHPTPGWAENDPDDWYRGLVQTVRAALAASAVDPERVGGLSIVCQREPVVLTDATGTPLARSISWTDTRAVAECDEIVARFGRDWLIETTGMAPTHGMSLAHLLWFQRHRTELWRSVRRIRFAKDYALHKLTGCQTTDPSTPSRSGMLDIGSQQWNEEICGAFGIEESMLPPIRERAWQTVAELPTAQAEELGLRPGLPVAMGGADDASAALGCGAILPGQACVGTGTATSWRTVLAGCTVDITGQGDISPHVVPDRYIHEVAIESTGSSLRWLRDVLADPADERGEDGVAALVSCAAEVECGADGLFCFPFVDGAARAPWYASGASAAYLGVRSGHGRAHLVRALLEGVAFQYRATMSILARSGPLAHPVVVGDPISIGDGEAMSALWTQLKADVLGVPLRVPRLADLAAAGAAILAGIAAGVFEDAVSGVARLVRWDHRYDPDPVRSAAYAQISAEYERAYRQIAQTFGRYRPADQGQKITSGDHLGAQP
jgi:xylulokinase